MTPHIVQTMEGVSPQGGPPVVRGETTVQYGGLLVIPAYVNGNVGGRLVGGEDVRLMPPEHHRPIHRDSSDIGDVYGRIVASSRTGSTDMVGTIRP